ncbi:hypothetical protein N7E81_18355 [Reichenbachiella carrageenanivorans]|uniref:FG-GAP repeat-containing protein n=1 Tax=Reichenbachiella carrageenanivorans TaxID=2979869 RepID=A0ABY6D2L8_9BACT|nr:hypothetical protein [Reichenbachiella carrageenanivorans]UXX79318.1 hypothetical protein N7E81_18355 [Reichenbachiella carrageenanivorans]
MNRKFYLPILCVISGVWLLGCMSEDSHSLDPSEVFIKYYGSESEEQVIDMLPLSDGFLLLGSRTDVDNADYYLVRTDSAGNRLWEGVINHDTVGSVDIPSKMYLDESNAADPRLYIAGTSSFDRADDNLDKVPVDHLFLASLSISPTGYSVIDTLVYRYSEVLSGVTTYYPTNGVDILGVEGEEELLVLATVSSGSNDPTLDDKSILLMRLSSDFQNKDWERKTGFGNDEIGKSLLNANGRYYYMAAVTTSSGVGNGGVDVLISEFDVVSGNEDNQMDYGTADNDEPANIIFTNPGIAVVGTTGSGSSQYAFILRVDSNLGSAQLRTLSYPKNSSGDLWNTQGYDLVQKTNGEFFVVGKVLSFTDENNDPREDEILLLPTDGIGEVYESKVQEYGSVQNDVGNAILLKEDGSMVIGATVHFGGSATMMSLMKTNRKGEFLRN